MTTRSRSNKNTTMPFGGGYSIGNRVVVNITLQGRRSACRSLEKGRAREGGGGSGLPFCTDCNVLVPLDE